MILTPEQYSIYSLMVINSKMLTEASFYDSGNVNKSYFLALDYNRYIIWEKLMSPECAEVSD